MEYLLIFITSFISWQWMSLYLQATSFWGGKQAIALLKDKKLPDVIFKKTGLRMASIRISASKRL